MVWYPGSLVFKNHPRPVLVGTGETFVAADPWNKGESAQFTVECYKIIRPDWGRAYGARLAKVHGVDLYKFRSSAGGPSRPLPESLTELWRSKRVATESIPQLLHDLQPSLCKYDYYRFLHHRIFEWAGAIYSLCLLGVMIFLLIAIPNEAAGAIFAPLTFGLLALASLFVSIFIPRRFRNRCRQQMEWILACELRKGPSDRRGRADIGVAPVNTKMRGEGR
jgi:hypothetical protein